MPHLPYGKRRDDPPPESQSLSFRARLRLKQANPFIIAFTISLMVCCIPLGLILVQQNEIKRQRREAITLLCTQNDVLVKLIVANPIPSGRAAALAKLNGQDCQKLLKEVGGAAEVQ